MPKLRLFLFWSVLWHLFQFILFTAFFKIDLPSQNSSKNEGALQVVAIQFEEVQEVISEQKEEKSNPSPKGIQKEEKVTVATLQKKAPKIPEIKKKTTAKKTKRVDRKPKIVPVKKDIQLASTKKPFEVSPSLKLRKLTYLPKLPRYPEWALEKDISLKLKIGLHVSQQGMVKRAWVDEPSGYSRIDTEVLHFVKRIEFEEKALSTRGYLYWEYQLEY